MTGPPGSKILPLYKKGQEEKYFDQAIIWLKKDVQQIVLTVGVEYEYNKQILYNINKFFLHFSLLSDQIAM